MQVQDEGSRTIDWSVRACSFGALSACSGLVVDGLCEGHSREIFQIAMK